MSHSGCVWLRDRGLTDGKAIVAHRGASALHHESSIASFEAAIALGVSGIETDIRLSKDGVLLCCHDATLERISSDSRAVADLTWDEISAATGGTAVTMAAAAAAVGHSCALLFDLKLSDPADIARFAAGLEEANAVADIAVGVRSLAAAAQIRQVHPDQPLVGLLGNSDALEAFARLGNCWWRIWESDLTDARIADTRRAGLPLLIMVGGKTSGHEVGDIGLPQLETLLGRDIDGLMLNDPRLPLQSFTGQSGHAAAGTGTSHV